MKTCGIQPNVQSIQLTLTRPAVTQLRRRKNIFIDQERIDRVRTLLRAETETETIDRALAMAEDYVAFEAQVLGGLAGLSGHGDIEDHFSPKRRVR